MAGYTLIIVVVTLVLQGLSLTAGQTATHASETSLRAALSSGYDQTARPYTPTNIDIAYFLRSVQAVVIIFLPFLPKYDREFAYDIAAQIFSHTAMLLFMWHDPRLVWNATDYSNITKLDIKTTWRPMFAIGNGVEDMDIWGSDDDSARVTVFNNGSVMWTLGLTDDTACDMNVLNFPFDAQECHVYLVFFGNDYGNDFSFNITTAEVQTGIYIQNGEWEMQSSSIGVVHLPICCPLTELSYLDVSIEFERLHTFYLNSFLIPTVILSICLIMPFYLPTDSGERLGFALTILLSYTVLLSLTADFLPTTSRQVPYLGQYLLTVLFMCALSVINVALHVKLFHLTSPPPGYMKTMAKKMKPIVFFEYCFRRKSGKVEDNVITVNVEAANAEKPPIYKEQPRADSEASTSTADDEDMTWVDVVTVMDRICFFLYTLAVLILNIVLLTFLSAG